jgi:hypothetical protein
MNHKDFLKVPLLFLQPMFLGAAIDLLTGLYLIELIFMIMNFSVKRYLTGLFKIYYPIKN